MVVQLSLEYHQVIEIVSQLTDEQRESLLAYLSQNRSQKMLSSAQRKAIFHANILAHTILEEPSVRREDWYGDDGR